MKALFKDSWESLIGNCDEFLYLGGNEKEGHKYVSELLGERNTGYQYLWADQGKGWKLFCEFPAVRKGCAILVREEFSCLEFIMNRDTINWILK